MIPGLDRLTLKLIFGIACALALALLVHDRSRWKAKTAHYVEMLSAERAAHAAAVANVRAATEQARQADRANVERIKALQSAINQRSESDYERRIADARAAAAAGRMRGEQPHAPADPGGR